MLLLMYSYCVLKYLLLRSYRLSCPYCCRYADFLTRLNDDRNIRALFERALSSLPSEESVEVRHLLSCT